jgi:UDP-glucose 4-epimerase
MKVLVTGSAGHLGEALVRGLQKTAYEVVSIDLKPSPFTSNVGSVTDRGCVRQCMRGVEAVLHAATLHKPHLITHSRQDFIDTNIAGTLNLLEEAASAGVTSFVLTSTTSVFGAALTPPAGAPAVWVTENIRPVPKNIYGVTKGAAEDLCELFHRSCKIRCVILRTSRFFPEEDDNPTTRKAYDDGNVKMNEFLYRRVDLEDVVNARLLAIEKAPLLGFGRYIISATTPFNPGDLLDLRTNAPEVVRLRAPEYEDVYRRRGWRMFPGIDRVYINERARQELDWHPRYDFRRVLNLLKSGVDTRSPLARVVGLKGYHAGQFADGLYPVS